MPYNTKPILTDVNGKPIPQYFDNNLDDYKPLFGTGGANLVIPCDANGNPLAPAGEKLRVRATEIEALAGALTDAAVTDPTASATIIALLKGLLKQHQGGGTIKDQVDVIDRAARVLGKITADDAAIVALGALAAAAVTDPAASASVIALLKGLLKQLQGTGTGAAPVQLTGRYVQPQIVTWQPSLTDWNPGVERQDSVVDLTVTPGIYALGLGVDSDQPIQLEYRTAPAAGTGSIAAGPSAVRLRVVLPPSTYAGLGEFVSAFRPMGGRYLIHATNRGDAIPTRCTIYQYRYNTVVSQPQNLRALLVRALAIRDTSEHNYGTDPNNIYTLIRFILGGGKVPIFVNNGLNQAVDLKVVLRLGGVTYDFALGTKNVAAGGIVVITNADFPGIDVPSEVIEVRPKCATAPTSGQLDVWIDTLVGGM